MPRVEAETVHKKATPYFLRCENKNNDGEAIVELIDAEPHPYAADRTFPSIGMVSFLFSVRRPHEVNVRLMQMTKGTRLKTFGSTSETSAELPKHVYSFSHLLTPDQPEAILINRKSRTIVKLRLANKPSSIDPLEPNPIGVPPGHSPPVLRASVGLEEPQNTNN